MCFVAIYWASIDTIYYANNRKDAARIGFSDDFIYQEIREAPAQREKPMIELLPDEGKKAFEMWENSKDKKEY